MSTWLSVVGPEVQKFTACICGPESADLGVSPVTVLSNTKVGRESDARTNHDSPENTDSFDISNLEGANGDLRSLTFGDPFASSLLRIRPVDPLG